MQALMNFKKDFDDSAVGNEDMQEEIKGMLKNFHSNLLVLQQVVEVWHMRKTNRLFEDFLF
jgi:hypothetical protein